MPFWIAVGDLHDRADRIREIPEIEAAEGILVSGDMTNRGGVPSVEAVLDTLRRARPRVLAQVGNMDEDPGGVSLHLARRDMNLHRSVVELFPGAKRRIGAFGVGFSTPTPFGTPGEVSDEQLGLWLRETYAKAQDFDELVVVSHTPPLDTATDRLTSGGHVGSAALRAFLEETQPALCVCGHIHESVGEDRIGRTRVLNPGMLDHGGYVRIELDEKTGELSGTLMQV